MRAQLVVLVAVMSCNKAGQEKKKCFDAVDKARLAWLAVAESERAAVEESSIEKSFDASKKAFDEWGRLMELSHRIGCVRTNSVVSLKKLDNYPFFAKAPEEAKNAVAAARELAKSASDADKTIIAADTVEVEKALPEFEKLLAAAKPDSVASPALLAAAKKVADPCGRLFMVGFNMNQAAEEAAKAAGDGATSNADLILAEKQKHLDRLKAALAAAKAVSETVRPGQYDVPEELKDAKYADAQQATRAVKDVCK